MKKINLYKISGSLEGKINIPSEYYLEEENPELLAQAIHVYRSRLHTGSSRTKTRSEISRTKQKWFRQKGTGRARHGSRSASIFVGGFKAHGPKGIDRVLTLPQKMKQKALRIAFYLKLKDEKVFGISDFSRLKKTSEMSNLVTKLLKNEKKKGRVSVILSEKNTEKRKFMKNLLGVSVLNARTLNAYDIFFAGNIFFDADMIIKKGEVKK